MSRLNTIDARCTALFASGLQRSDALTSDAVAKATYTFEYGTTGPGGAAPASVRITMAGCCW